MLRCGAAVLLGTRLQLSQRRRLLGVSSDRWLAAYITAASNVAVCTVRRGKSPPRPPSTSDDIAAPSLAAVLLGSRKRCTRRPAKDLAIGIEILSTCLAVISKCS